MSDNPYGAPGPPHGQDPRGQDPTVAQPSAPPSLDEQPPAYGQAPPPGYGGQPGYGAPQGYSPPQGYGSPQGYGAPQGYGRAPGGYPSAPPPSSPGDQAKGFAGSLFDFSFTSFVTPKIIKVLYILLVVLIGLFYLGILAAGFSSGAGVGLLALVGGAIYSIILLALARVGLEFYMAFFRMADDVQQLKRQGTS